MVDGPMMFPEHDAGANAGGRVGEPPEQRVLGDRPSRAADRLLALRHAVTTILAGSLAAEEALPLVLQAIGGHLDWPLGTYWTVDRDGGELRLAALWQSPSEAIAQVVAQYRCLSFAGGIGVPGRVWADRLPVAMPLSLVESGFPIPSLASGPTMHWAVGFPVEAGTRLHGVLVCFSPDQEDLATNLGPVLRALGWEIGDFLDRVQADKARRLAERRIAAILDTALDAIVIMDAQGWVVECNPVAERMFGYPRADAVGRELAALIVPPDLRERHRQGLATYLATGVGSLIGRRVELTAMRADQSLFPAELAITHISLEGPQLFTGYIRDLTERARAEEERAALHARERAARADALERASQLEATFEAMTDAVFVFDHTEQVRHANTALRTLFGLEPDFGSRLAREKLTVFTPYDELGKSLPPEERPSYRILNGEILTGARAMDVGVMTRTARGLRLNISGTPVRGTDGGIVGGIMVMRDVTERRRLERRTHEALQTLLGMAGTLVGGQDVGQEASPRRMAERLVKLARDVLGCRRVTLSLLDAQTGFLHPLAVVGLTTAEEEAWRAAPPSRLEGGDPELSSRLLAGQVVSIDVTQPAYRGGAAPSDAPVILVTLLRVAATPVGLLSLDYGGQEPAHAADAIALVGAIAQFAALVIERERLLAEREEARASAEALREANRRMDAFLGIAGHEMRTPLTTISGHVQLAIRRIGRLLDDDSRPIGELLEGLAALKRSLNRAEDGLSRLNQLVADLLDVSRIDAGHLAVRMAPCDLAGVVREVVDQYREIAAPRPVNLSITSTGPLIVRGDEERLGQVLSNYLSNALKYSPSTQPVTVGLDVDGTDARAWVRDAGPGVAAADRRRIWDRFYRVPGIEPLQGSNVGLGLGLHICRSIIEHHGGQIGVDSVPGEGATFWFTLPLPPPT